MFLLLLGSQHSLVRGTDLDTDRKARMKAAWIYHLAKFVRWPKATFPSEFHPIHICISGSDAVNRYVLPTMETKRIHNRPIRISRAEKGFSSATLKTCHVLYLGEIAGERSEPDWSEIKRLPVLTITMRNSEQTYPSVIELLVVGNKFRIKVYQEAAKEKGLTISSELLDLAILK